MEMKPELWRGEVGASSAGRRGARGGCGGDVDAQLGDWLGWGQGVQKDAAQVLGSSATVVLEDLHFDRSRLVRTG